MPVKITKNSKGGYKVSTPNGTKAKNTTKANAKAQERLLNTIDHGFKLTGKKNVTAKKLKVSKRK